MRFQPWVGTATRVALALSLSLACSRTGLAYQTGIVGLSGKSNGFYCRNCHAGGTVPLVAFEGPTVVQPGMMATFRFTVISQAAGQTLAGFDVAGSGGTLGLVPEQGTRLELNEVTHSTPKENDGNGQASFELTWQAPASEGEYTLFGAAVSANGNHERTGDAAARTTYGVVVSASLPTPTPTPPAATPTATATTGAATCVGDCGVDGQVTVDEIITGVNIALGLAPVSECQAFDASGDQQVTVDEILRAVSNALTGCGL